MKRMALTLAAFALTGALAFADDPAPLPKVSGEVNDGVVLSNNSDGTFLKNYGIDYGSGNSGATVLGAIDLAGSNYGYSIAFAYKGTGGILIDHGYGWVKPVDSVELYAGASGNNAPFGDLDDNGSGAYSTSAIGAFYSNNGFSLGAQLSPDAVATVGTGASAFIPGSQNVPFWLGARYAMDKTFTVNAYGTNGDNNKLDSLHITASVLAVTGLTLTGGYNSSGGGTGTFTDFADATVAYAVTDAFTAGVTGYDDNISSGTNFFVYKPFLSYALTPGMLAFNAYLIGDTSSDPNYEPEGQLAYTPVAGVTIKATAWYDTKSAGVGYAGIHSNYTSDVVKSTDGQFSAALDAKFAF